MRPLAPFVALLLAAVPMAAAAAPTPLGLLRALTRPLTVGQESTFGRSVAVSPDHVLVGDPSHLGTTGIAYLFDARTGRWLRTLGGAATDPSLLGSHVGFLGSAPLVGGRGAILLFDSPPPAPGQVFPAPDADGDPPIGFGRALAALDATHVLVGYPGATSEPGRVLVIDAETGAESAMLTAPTPLVGDHFGHAITLTADAILVGAPFGDAATDTYQQAGSEAAAVHVFDRATLGWQRALTPPNPSAGSLFGHAVAANGTTIVVGAPGEHAAADGEGAAYLFDLQTGGLRRRIAGPNAPRAHDRFGFAVAAPSDRIVVGAPHDDAEERPGAGTASVFDSEGALLQTLIGTRTNARFGWSMAAFGGSVVIGAPSPIDRAGYVGIYSPCGNGAVDPAETCDDGNDVDGDGCDSNCSVTACGNGIQTAGEACDLGALNGFGRACRIDCTRDVCGDGYSNLQGWCDDGNRVDGDGCDNVCLPSMCFGGAQIDRPQLVIDKWGAPFGDERVHVQGRLVFADGAPPRSFDPATRGAQIRVEVVAPDGPVEPSVLQVIGMHGNRPIPAGLRGAGCTPVDGWRVRSQGRLQTYANPSGRLRPPECGRFVTATVDRLHFGLWRGNGRLDFRARSHVQSLDYADEPTSARVVVVLGAESDAGRSGDCGVTTLTRCRVDRGTKRLRCRS